MFKYMLLISSFLLAFDMQNVYADTKEEDIVNLPQKSASMIVEDNYNAWRKNVSNKLIQKCEAEKKDTTLPECNFSTNITYGDANVKVKSNNVNWVNARSMAYNEALVNALAKIALEQSTTNQNVILKELIDDPTPLDENELKASSRIEALWDKAIAVAGGKLDKKLEELGINPEQYKQANPEKRKTMMKDAVIQRSITKAMADTSGIVPLQTFEGNDANGNYAIRVAVSKSPKRIALVKSMLQEGYKIPANANKKAKKTIDERVIISEDILFNQFGVRLMYDKAGYPVLVSFGQAGAPSDGSETMKAMKIESARNLAKTNARSALTNLLHSSTIFNSVVEQMSQTSADMKMVMENGGIDTEYIETSDYQNSSNTTSKTSSQITNFAGIKEIHNWSYIHPQLGHVVVGTILMWSPQTAARAKGVDQIKDETTEEEKIVTEEQGSSRGIETDDYDF